MATLVAALATFPALDQALNAHDYEKSRLLYNSLKDDGALPRVADEHIQKLAALFVRHNAHKAFVIHLIHGHFQIQECTVMVGTNFQNPEMRWTKPIDFKTLDGSSIHGHIFVVTDGGLHAYEYQDGSLPDLTGVGKDFLVEFSHYILAHDLADLIGLQVLVDGAGSCHGMSELILPEGTIMLDTSFPRNCQPTRITDWTFESLDGSPRVCMANETHAAMNTGNHKVYNVGKPLPKLENVDDLKAVLTEAGVM